MIWRFQNFELDEARFELRRGGRRVSLQPKPLRVLLYLAKRAPHAVSQEELLRVLWPGVRVSAASLSRAVLAARRALGANGDDGILSTVRGFGYSFAQVTAPRAPPGVTGVAPESTPFVDRDVELGRIESVLEDVAAGRGRLLLIGGEPGIGKSRLLDELVKRAALHSALVVGGSCRPDDGAPPYWPLPEIARGLHDLGLDVPADRLLTRWAVERPGRRNVGGGKGDAAGPLSADGDARFRLFFDFTELLRRSAVERMLVVTVEDLHWATPGTMQLLRFVGRSIGKERILLALTYRNPGPPLSPDVRAAIGEICGLAGTVEILLKGFPVNAAKTYVGHVIGRTPDMSLVARLQEATAGNPLFLRDLAPRLAEESLGSTGLLRMPVPLSVVGILDSQIDRLEAPTRDLIEIASVIGREFAPQLLARITRRRLDGVLALLDAARAENLIVDDGIGRLRFRHDVVRAALYDKLEARRRIDIHRRIAKAIEDGGGAEAEVTELAHHLFEALPVVGPRKVADVAKLAAQAARDSLDFDAAARYLRQALLALEAAGPGDEGERCDLLLEMGEVLEPSGRLHEARAAIFAAAELARRCRSTKRLGQAALAVTAWQFVLLADVAALRLVEEALRAVGKRPSVLRARLLARLAVLRKVGGDEAGALALIDEALQWEERCGDPSLRCELLLQRLLVVQFGIPGDQVKRLRLANQVLETAQRVDNSYAVLQCRRHRISLLLDAGDGAALGEEIERFARDSAAAGSKKQYATGFRAMRAIVEGRFANAVEMIDEAERLADPFSVEESRFTPLGQRVTLPPRYRDSEGVFRAIAEVAGEPPLMSWRYGLALVALDLGRTDFARATLVDFAEGDFALVPHDVTHVIGLASLALVAWRLGEHACAGRLFELLLPQSGMQVSSGLGMVYQGPVDWYLGALATMLDRQRAAAHHFEIALATTERLGARPWRAHTQLAYASLLASGRAKARAVRSLAAEAEEAGRRFGMDELQREAKALLDKLAR